MSKENLKRGILAGLDDFDSADSDEGLNIKNIDMDLIKPSAQNSYSIENIEELAEDIRENGLYHPILVRSVGEGYEIISGERRYTACRRLGWGKMPCSIREGVDDIDSEIMLIQANARSRVLTDMEKARQVKRLEELYQAKKKRGENISGRIRDKISKDMGLSGAQVHRYKKLNDLIPDLQELVDSGRLPMSTAEHFAGMEPKEQQTVFELIKEKGLSIGREEAKGLKQSFEKQKEAFDREKAAKDKAIVTLQEALSGSEGDIQKLKGQIQKLEDSVEKAKDIPAEDPGRDKKIRELEEALRLERSRLKMREDEIQSLRSDKSKLESKLKDSTDDEDGLKIQQAQIEIRHALGVLNSNLLSLSLVFGKHTKVNKLNLCDESQKQIQSIKKNIKLLKQLSKDAFEKDYFDFIE